MGVDYQIGAYVHISSPNILPIFPSLIKVLISGNTLLSQRRTCQMSITICYNVTGPMCLKMFKKKSAAIFLQKHVFI